jgi:hypothetical protein
VEESENEVKYQICGDIFTKKNARMLSHPRYIYNTSERDNNVRLCKNMKPDMARAFRGCSGVALAPPKPAKSQHLQGSVQIKEPICQGS